MRFDGAVHDEASADMGNNRQRECVVRLDLTYKRGTSPSKTTMIITLDAAIALRDQLDGWLNAERVQPEDACPRCSNAIMDKLVIDDAGEVHCTVCGKGYRAT